MDHCPILCVIRDLQHKILDVLLFPLDVDQVECGHFSKIDLQPFLRPRTSSSLIGCPARLAIAIDGQIGRKARAVFDIIGSCCRSQCQVRRCRTGRYGRRIGAHANAQSEDHAAHERQHGELSHYFLHFSPP